MGHYLPTAPRQASQDQMCEVLGTRQHRENPSVQALFGECAVLTRGHRTPKHRIGISEIGFAVKTAIPLHSWASESAEQVGHLL